MRVKWHKNLMDWCITSPDTAAELCEAFAARKGWRLRKGGRLDVYRAANWILRAALSGRSGVSLAFLPPE
jgi:ribosome biogenesis GTPase A